MLRSDTIISGKKVKWTAPGQPDQVRTCPEGSAILHQALGHDLLAVMDSAGFRETSESAEGFPEASGDAKRR